MKKSIYLTIIAVISIILIILSIYTFNNFKDNKNVVICTKELTMLDVKYENKYLINVGKEMEISSLEMINTYKDITDTKKEEIKNYIGVNSEESNYTCNSPPAASSSSASSSSIKGACS